MIRRALSLVSLTLVASHATASAQARPDSVGRFAVVVGADPITDEDESWAVVSDVETRSVNLYWACDGSRLVIQLQPQPAGAGRSLTWRFDQDEPRTATWQGGEGLRGDVTRLPRAEHHAFTTRARSASRLVIRQRIDGESRDWFFDLAGSERALQRLACVRSLRPPVLGATRDSAGARATRRPANEAERYQPVEVAPTLLDQEGLAALLRQEMPREVAGGRVVLRLRVDTDGTVDPDGGVRVESSADPALTAAALRVVPRMRFSPGTLNGRPVRMWVELPLDFLPRR